MASQCVTHRLRMLFPQTGRALEIGEQERDRARRQLAHRTPLLVQAASKPGSRTIRHRRVTVQRRARLCPLSALPCRGPRHTADTTANSWLQVGKPKTYLPICAHATRTERGHLTSSDDDAHECIN